MHSIEELSSLLQNCCQKKELRTCFKLYSKSAEWGLECHVVLGGFFVRAFESCDSLFEASKYFLRLPVRNVFAWSAIISAHASKGFCRYAIELYKVMVCSEAQPDSHTFVATLKACAQSFCVIYGMLIHNHIIESKMELDCHISNVLLDFYGKNCLMIDARNIFDRFIEPDIVAWNTVISAFAREKNQEEALHLFQLMQSARVKPDTITISSILTAFSESAVLDGSMLMHAWIIEKDFAGDAVIWSILIDVYGKNNRMMDAQKLFSSLSTRDDVAWNTMLACYAFHEMWEEAFLVFKNMMLAPVRPGHVTCATVLKVIAELLSFEDGRLLHAYVVERAYDFYDYVVNSLINMYTKCSSLLDAGGILNSSQKKENLAWSVLLAGFFQQGLVTEAFRLLQIMKAKVSTPHTDVWNAMIDGCAQNDLDHLAFTFFVQMQDEYVTPDSFTYTSILKACWKSLDLECCKIMHSLITEADFYQNHYVETALVGMYSKFGKLEDAYEIFSQHSRPDVVCWNSLIEGYADQQLGEEAISFYRLMQQSGHKPDKETFLSVLKACAIIAAIQEGMAIHAAAIGMSLESEEYIGSSLIDMYSRIGLLEEASKIFEGFRHFRSAWNSIIAGSARNGQYKADAYVSMLSHGIVPDRVTYVCLLSACSRLGLVQEGCSHYLTMMQFWNIKPTTEHYGCMVDLWGRLGCLNEAIQVVVTVPLEKSLIGHRSLLHHAQMHGRYDLARKCLDEVLLVTGCENTSAYMTMARFFGDVWLHEEFEIVRESTYFNEKWNITTMAFIETGGKLHTFMVSEAHEAMEVVYSKLKSLLWASRIQGFIPNANITMTKLPANEISLSQFEDIYFASKGKKQWFESHSSRL